MIYAFCKIKAESNRSSRQIPEDLQTLIATQSPAWQITPEQTEQGLNWLRKKEIIIFLSENQQEILENFSHFLFIGTKEIAKEYGFTFSYPIYRVCGKGKKGRKSFFDYIPQPFNRQKPLKIA